MQAFPGLSPLVHRFLISGLDLGITARFSPETHSNAQRFRISWGQFGNRWKELPGNVLLRAAILDFEPRLENHCKIFPRNTLQRAAIPDFMGSIWESLQGYARLRPPACSDSGFQRLNLEITAGFSPETAPGLQ